MKSMPTASRRTARLALAVLALAALGGVWMLYTRPGFLVQLADQLWACF